MLLTCFYLDLKMEYFNNYLIHYFLFFLGNVSFFPSPMEKFLRFLVDPLLKPEDTLRFCQEATLQPKVLVLGSDLPTTLAFCALLAFLNLPNLLRPPAPVPAPCPPLSSGASPYKSRLPSFRLPICFVFVDWTLCRSDSRSSLILRIFAPLDLIINCSR